MSNNFASSPGCPAAAIQFATRPATRKRTFGYYRLEILSALANGILLALVAGGWWYWNRGEELPDAPGFEDADLEEAAVGERAGDRAIMLVFSEWDASGYVTEQRQIPSRDRPGEDLLGIMAVLCSGPHISGAVSAANAIRIATARIGPLNRLMPGRCSWSP